MEKNTKENPAVPWIKFRWCLSIPCQTKKVYLILTSITGSEIHLDWKNDLGWFESNILCLPCGFHTGFILIREKALSSPNLLDSHITERDYQIDPFFISPHKFSVQLFLQNSVALGFWKENILRKQYLSLHNIGSELEKEDCAFSKQKSLSCEELRTAVKPFIFDQGDDNTILNNKRKSASGNIICNFDGNTVKSNCKSLDKERASLVTGNISFSEEENNFDYPHIKSLNKFDKQGEDFSFDAVIQKCDKDNLRASLLQSYNQNLCHEDFSESVLVTSKDSDRKEYPTLETSNIASSRNFQKGIYIRQINLPKCEGYDGCLITFESGSKSMNDVESSHALEEEFVSLNSVETRRKENSQSDSKENKRDNIFDTKNKDQNPHSDFNPSIPSFKRDFSQVSPSSSSASENLSRNFDSYISIHEDENFQYDSLKNDEHKIPINIKKLEDSDESSSCSNRDRLICLSAEKKEIDKLDDQQDLLSENIDHRKNSNAFVYNNLGLDYTDTLMDEKTSDLFVPVDPGSLRSETDNLLEECSNKIQFSLKPIRMSKISDKERRFLNSIQAITSIKSDRQLKMNSIGTQTSPVANFIDADTCSSIGLIKSIPKRFKKSYFNPLPDKIASPFKFLTNQADLLPTPNSEVKLQKNLHNISRANNILKKMHPFDYRPTLIHKNKINLLKSEQNFRPDTKSPTSARNFSVNRWATYSDFDNNKTKGSFVSFKNDLSPASSLSFTRMLKNSSLLMDSASPYLFSTNNKQFSKSPMSLSNHMINIYGKDYSEYNQKPSANNFQIHDARSPPISSILCQRNLLPSRIAVSDPNLNIEINQRRFFPEYHERKKRQRSSSLSFFDEKYDAETHNVYSSTSFDDRRRKGYEGTRFRRASNDASTDLLLEEAFNLSEDLQGFKSREYTSEKIISRNYLSNKNENSLSKILRARSETDLRLIGKIGGGYTNDPPYLPYRREELSLGQIVKVLIPGEGVALARIVYNPIYQHHSDENISVVLLSEPQSLLGTVVSIPLDKILLAWPKI